MPSYKPNRPVTSEKIKKELYRLDIYGDDYKRVFKKRLKVTGNWVRGFRLKHSQARAPQAIAISSPDDSKLLEVYLVDDCQTHAKNLGIEEVFNSD